MIPFWKRGLHRSDRVELLIDPGPSFGSGDHPTTVMALELLEVAVRSELENTDSPTMLDVGTGTGVLAIAGKALGGGFTVGLDIDPAAVYTARRNLELNEAAMQHAGDDNPVELAVGGIESVKGVFDIVTVNLVAPVLMRVHEYVAPRVGSFLVLSGIADPMVEEVLERYRLSGFDLLMRKQREEWNAALYGRGFSRARLDKDLP